MQQRTFRYLSDRVRDAQRDKNRIADHLHVSLMFPWEREVKRQIKHLEARLSKAKGKRRRIIQVVLNEIGRDAEAIREKILLNCTPEALKALKAFERKKFKVK